MVYSNKQLLNYSRFFQKITENQNRVYIGRVSTPIEETLYSVSKAFKKVDDINISSLKVDNSGVVHYKVKKKARFYNKFSKNKRHYGKKTSFLNPKGIIVVQATKNNTIITLTDLHGKTKYWASAGSCGYKGKQKSSYIITKYVAEKVAKEALALGLNIVILKIKGTHKPKKLSAISGFIGEKINITKIVNLTSLPHNGCRIQKRRRR